LQCVAVCCSVLQCVAVCCSVLQCYSVCCSVLQCVLQCVAACCSVLQYSPMMRHTRATWCMRIVLQCVAMLHCVALCCIVLQYSYKMLQALGSTRVSKETYKYEKETGKRGLCIVTLQHITQCNTPATHQQNTSNTPHTAPHCTTLHHTATHCNTLQHDITRGLCVVSLAYQMNSSSRTVQAPETASEIATNSCNGRSSCSHCQQSIFA